MERVRILDIIINSRRIKDSKASPSSLVRLTFYCIQPNHAPPLEGSVASALAPQTHTDTRLSERKALQPQSHMIPAVLPVVPGLD
eukprot:COSAG03_NODE_12060_length_563_cov_1.215517_1_plen_84_part_01